MASRALYHGSRVIGGLAIGGAPRYRVHSSAVQVPRQTCTSPGDEVLGAEKMTVPHRDFLLHCRGVQDTPIGVERDGGNSNSVLVHDPDNLLPLVVSTTRAVLSPLPVARYRPSALKATS
jgi:hypothetical protein